MFSGLSRCTAGDTVAALTSSAPSPIALTFMASSGAHGSAKMGNRRSRHPRTLISAPVTFTGPALSGVPDILMICVRYGPITVVSTADSNSAPSVSSRMLSSSTSTSNGFCSVSRKLAGSPATSVRSTVPVSGRFRKGL